MRWKKVVFALAAKVNVSKTLLKRWVFDFISETSKHNKKHSSRQKLFKTYFPYSLYISDIFLINRLKVLLMMSKSRADWEFILPQFAVWVAETTLVQWDYGCSTPYDYYSYINWLHSCLENIQQKNSNNDFWVSANDVKQWFPHPKQ